MVVGEYVCCWVVQCQGLVGVEWVVVQWGIEWFVVFWEWFFGYVGFGEEVGDVFWVYDEWIYVIGGIFVGFEVWYIYIVLVFFVLGQQCVVWIEWLVGYVV